MYEVRAEILGTYRNRRVVGSDGHAGGAVLRRKVLEPPKHGSMDKSDGNICSLHDILLSVGYQCAEAVYGRQA